MSDLASGIGIQPVTPASRMTNRAFHRSFLLTRRRWDSLLVSSPPPIQCISDTDRKEAVRTPIQIAVSAQFSEILDLDITKTAAKRFRKLVSDDATAFTKQSTFVHCGESDRRGVADTFRAGGRCSLSEFCSLQTCIGVRSRKCAAVHPTDHGNSTKRVPALGTTTCQTVAIRTNCERVTRLHRPSGNRCGRFVRRASDRARLWIQESSGILSF